MISIITSLYKSDEHLPNFIKRVRKMSEYLKKNGIIHEFIILPNNPNKKEEKLLKQTIENTRIFPRNLETLYTTWNAGIRYAKYENICFWNVDDKRFGKSMLSGLRDMYSGADIVYFSFIYFRYLKISNVKILAKIKLFFPPKFEKNRFSREMHCGPFFMTNKKSFSKIGFFDETFYVAGDYEWCVRAAIFGLKFKKNNTIAGILTSDGTTLSGSRSARHAEENERVHNMIQP